MFHEFNVAGYLSPEQREHEFAYLVDNHHAESALIQYGESIEGRPLIAARLASRAGDDVPKVICCANIHGVEYIGNRICHALFHEAVTAQTGPLSLLRNRAEIWFVPCINPDGYARTWKQTGIGPLSELRTNARGVDLNRNFPIPFQKALSRIPGSGSTNFGDATYRGPFPLSEPETKYLDDLFRKQQFHASANLHSFMGTVIPARVTDHTAYQGYRRLAKSIRNAQPQFKYFRLANRRFDVFTGEQEDHQHHCHRTWSVCVETFSLAASFRQHWRAPSRFWRFNPREADPWIRNDIAGLVAYFLAALDMARPPRSSAILNNPLTWDQKD